MLNRPAYQRAMQYLVQALLLTATLIGSWAQAAELSAAERQTLIFMREEEKLARDVYLTLSELWSQPIFANIAQSEQQHLEVMLMMIKRYHLADPAIPTAGMFANTELQTLYNELIIQGQESLTKALYAGAKIEEIDMLDLQKAIAETDQPDLRRSYENLLAGSGNHLRAFVRNIEAQGLVYEPQYLPVEQLETILATPTQRSSSGGQPGRGGRRWR